MILLISALQVARIIRIATMANQLAKLLLIEFQELQLNVNTP
jgi:hypothetical protein